MEGNTQNKEYVKAGLNRRAEARKEAIRKEEEAHAKFERVMIQTVNEQHAGANRNRDNDSVEAASSEAKKSESVREFKRKRALARAIADGDDYMLEIYICSIAFVVTAILRSFGTMLVGTGIVIRALLAAWFAYNVYRLYQVSGAIAKLAYDGGADYGEGE